MTTIQTFSDLHVDEIANTPVLAPGADLVVVAGDTCRGTEAGFAFLRQALGPGVPIACVAGNHEFWGRCLPDERAAAQATAVRHGIAFLDDATTVVAGVRLVGATLWTDYDLAGPVWRAVAMAHAKRTTRDHAAIRMDASGERRLSTGDALALHRASRAFIERTLAEPFDGPTVVVTHHAPSPRSLSGRHPGGGLAASAWVASDLEAVMIEHGPALWLHGHTHESFDYRVGVTRVVCNPHGYGDQNPDFDPTLVVAV